MKKNMTAKIFAFLALLGIVSSIVGTWILFLYETKLSPNAPQPTLEDYLKNNPIDLSQENISSGTTASGETLLGPTLSGNTLNP